MALKVASLIAHTTTLKILGLVGLLKLNKPSPYVVTYATLTAAPLTSPAILIN
jgi:type IV secretory pathway component VirB8